MWDNDSWKTGDFKDGELFLVNVEYICQNIYRKQKKRIDATSAYNHETGKIDSLIDWTISKEYWVEDLFEQGKKSEDIWPIKVHLLPDRTYSVEDGITRLRVFRKRGIQEIYARMYHGD